MVVSDRSPLMVFDHEVTGRHLIWVIVRAPRASRDHAQ
jgi:hypothetical protein